LVSYRKRDIRQLNAPIREFIFTKRHNVIMQGCSVFVIFTIPVFVAMPNMSGENCKNDGFDLTA